MNSNIPTASEILSKYEVSDGDMILSTTMGNVEKALIEFAKLHCEAQRKAIKEQLEEALEDTFGLYLTDDFRLEQTGNTLIDEAYPLDKIK